MMTAPVQTVAPDDDLLDVASVRDANVRQLVVVGAARWSASITRRDVVRAMLAQHDEAEREPP